jgi:hypothetical protein
MFGVVYRDPTQWRDWHAVDDLTDRATEIVVVGTKTRETQHTLFLTQEVGSDGELRSTVGVPKVCIVHKRRLTEGENDD